MHTQVLLLTSLSLAQTAFGVVARAATNTNLQTTFPKATKTSSLPAVKTIGAGQTFDGGMIQWDRNPSTCNDQAEGGDADAVFLLESGATLSNAIIGPNNGEGVHCLGPCTLNNVWWTDVCEDAATFKQQSGISYVNGGGARKASDKVLQHNGAGTVHVRNFYVEDAGKVYRSCGNCGTQYARNSIFENVRVVDGGVVAGINGNLGDTTTIKNSCLIDTKICDRFKGVTKGEPSKTASGPDGTQCAALAVQTKGC
ncbi:polysaccharide lyase family 3 protein [Sporormia fimetaria CBS 119925]|uniref:Pectate lyase n=1 Tax=Sporormia fimetaria CBS 119925 TaxID=1340428 RepID=A0A6A6VIJ7_9PLEO|nr:polysaccharide lyase family 3 protein [Sporormia fimetaria CBS 119925]